MVDARTASHTAAPQLSKAFAAYNCRSSHPKMKVAWLLLLPPGRWTILSLTRPPFEMDARLRLCR